MEDNMQVLDELMREIEPNLEVRPEQSLQEAIRTIFIAVIKEILRQRREIRELKEKLHGR